MTSTAELAADFVALLKEGKHEEAARAYNADDIDGALRGHALSHCWRGGEGPR